MTLFAVDTSRWQGAISGAKLKGRGFNALCARCVVGQAERDSLYLMAKEQAEDNGLIFGAYGVSWPAGRNARADADNFVSRMSPSARPAMPRFLVGDHELGLHVSTYGHHLLSGLELVEYGIEYNAEVERQTGMACWFYTAAWYWNSSKLNPFIDRGETAFKVFPAHYPFDPRQISGAPPLYSPDVLDPAQHGTFVPLVPAPWKPQDMVALQWTSKGKGAAGGFCASTFMDRDVLFADLAGTVPPAPPTLEARVVRLETEARAHGWTLAQ